MHVTPIDIKRVQSRELRRRAADRSRMRGYGRDRQLRVVSGPVVPLRRRGAIFEFGRGGREDLPPAC